ESLAIAEHGRVIGLEPADQCASKLSGAAAFAETEEGPGPLAETIHQSRFVEEPQMPRQPRLRLPENLGESANRQFGLCEQRQDAQPCRLAGGFQSDG